MTLTGTSTLYQHPKAKTMYLTIPAGIASDSQFPWKPGDLLTLSLEGKTLKVKLAIEGEEEK